MTGGIGVTRLAARCGSALSVAAVLAAMLAVSPAAAEVPKTAAPPATVVSSEADEFLAGIVQSVSVSIPNVRDVSVHITEQIDGMEDDGAVVQASPELCDASGVSQFGDVVADGYGAAHILCARVLGLTKGKPDGGFGPDDDLTREQMAAFLVRLWRDVLNRDCPAEVSHGLVDIADSFAEADIECLYGLRITKGTTATTFSPVATLSTAAVTLFVARLLVRSGTVSCDLSEDELNAAAECLADLGVAASAEEAAASVDATRAMMAVYLVGAWHRASGRGQPAVSAPPRLVASLRHVEWLEQNRPELFSHLTALPWIADGTVYSELDAAETLIDSAIHHPDTFKALVRMPWIGDDDLTAAEADAIFGIRWLASDTPALAEQVLAKPWLQDDVTINEGAAVEDLYWLARSDPTLAEQMLAKPWLQGDITHDKGTIIEQLQRMAGTGDGPSRQTVVESARALLDMPFLDSVESSDAAAMWDLHSIASIDTNRFVNILAHPNLDDGITDQEAKVIAVLSSAYKYTPDSLPVVLDGLDGSGGVYVEERVIQLPLAGKTLLAIIRLQDQATASMDYLEHAVRFIEEFISEPFPTNYVALYFGPNPGINIFSHSHIMLESDYDIVRRILVVSHPSDNRS